MSCWWRNCPAMVSLAKAATSTHHSFSHPSPQHHCFLHPSQAQHQAVTHSLQRLHLGSRMVPGRLQHLSQRSPLPQPTKRRISTPVFPRAPQAPLPRPMCPCMAARAPHLTCPPRRSGVRQSSSWRRRSSSTPSTACLHLQAMRRLLVSMTPALPFQMLAAGPLRGFPHLLPMRTQ